MAYKTIYLILFLISVTLFNNKCKAQTSAVELYQAAENLRRAHQFEKALSFYLKAEKEEGANFFIKMGIGKSYQAMGEYHHAIYYYQETIKLNKNYVSAYLNISDCWSKLNDVEQVVLYLDSAFQKDEDLSMKMKYKARIIQLLISKYDYIGALQHIKQAKQLDVHNAYLLYHEAVIYNILGQYQDAVASMIKVTSEISSDQAVTLSAKYYYELGYAYHHMNMFREADLAFEKADFGDFKRKISRLKPNFYIDAARGYLMVGDLEKSNKLLHQALRKEHQNPEAYILLAEISDKSMLNHKASQQYEKTLHLKLNNSQSLMVYQKLATMYFYSHHYHKADKMIEEALHLQGKSFQMQVLSAMTAYKMKKYDLCVERVNTILSGDHINQKLRVYVTFIRGLAYQELEEFEEARVAFQQAAQGPLIAVAELELQKTEQMAVAVLISNHSTSSSKSSLGSLQSAGN